MHGFRGCRRWNAAHELTGGANDCHCALKELKARNIEEWLVALGVQRALVQKRHDVWTRDDVSLATMRTNHEALMEVLGMSHSQVRTRDPCCSLCASHP
jgi:hypothetical protein